MYKKTGIRNWYHQHHNPVLDKNWFNGYHYANTPMQYTAIFHGCKNVHFQIKFFNIFLIFAQNIDCGYT